ncbi:alpha-mannosyltransferase [Colletotrichum acutatum]
MSLTSASVHVGSSSKRRKLHSGIPENVEAKFQEQSGATDDAHWLSNGFTTQEGSRNPVSPEICYGSLDGIPLRLTDSTKTASHHDLDLLSWNGSKYLKSLDGLSVSYELPRRAIDIFRTLSDKAKVLLDVRLHVSNPEPPVTRRQRLKKVTNDSSPVLSATANLYGSRALSDSVSTFLESCHAFLQVPDRCTYDVPYVNPQCLSSPDDNTVMTSAFNGDITLQWACDNSQNDDLFDELGNDEEFEEAPQPDLLRARLKGYKNNINGLTQCEAPKDFRGGVLADEMGLGKTLTMLALSAAARDPKSDCSCQVGKDSPDATENILGTLVVVPLSRTQNARAVCALEATHRWCITGTPLQNRTQDIFSLLKFLRVYPYDSFEVFDRDITKPCKVQVEERGLQLLRKLMRMVTLHRSKKVIELPSIQEAIQEVEMTTAEQSMYEEARDGTRRFISDVLDSEAGAQGSSYIHAFRRVNDMRYICNNGIRQRGRRLNPSPLSEVESESETGVDELDHILDNLDEACFDCGTDITDAQESYDIREVLTDMKANQQQICVECSRRQLHTQQPDTDLEDPVASQVESQTLATEPLLSSKVKAVASFVESIPRGEKCVIFSFWTTTLETMQRALDDCGISSCCYRGDMKYAVRTESLKKFSNDETIKAILVSISCGGQGLDLTIANHCILIEPQWNPMVEEQAIARVHRLGQQHAVSVTRFVMKGTIERKVLERQMRKKVLANLVLGREKIKEGENGKKQLANLMQLIY